MMSDFSEEEKQGLYRAIFERRDIRKEFLPTPVPKAVLLKLLNAAHHAASVGFMQPWNFIVVEDLSVRQEIKAVFEEENRRACENYVGGRKKHYASMKLEGILEAPVNLCVTCDSFRNGPHVLGRNTILETDLLSTCCAIQNLWLAARCEGIGVGWVSIMNPERLKGILRVPESIKVVGYLCLGYVSEFPKAPMLETEGWEKRIPLESLVFWNKWLHSTSPDGVERGVAQLG